MANQTADKALKIITVDGPSGSGKGTISGILSQKYSYHLLDSGSIYRIVALAAMRKNISDKNDAALVGIAESLHMQFSSENGSTFAFLEGDNVSHAIRDEKVGLMASKIAPIASLRAALLDRQREFAVMPGLVADGRDMGTVVFPEAQHKFFLTATAEERCRRRTEQLSLAGKSDIDEARILRDIRARDERDINRSVSPLKPAHDAQLIDSTGLTIDEVVKVIDERILRERGIDKTK